MENRVEVQLPQGLDVADYRKLGTTLKPGQCKELYTGVLVCNEGRYPCTLRILTPKSEMYEQMLEDFRAKA